MIRCLLWVSSMQMQSVKFGDCFALGGQLTTLLDNKINSLFCQASSQQENFDRPLANKRINNEFFYANGQLKI